MRAAMRNPDRRFAVNLRRVCFVPRCIWFAVLVLGMGLASPMPLAQTPHPQPAAAGVVLTGNVADPAGKPIRSATVTLHAEAGSDRIATTDTLGRFVFQKLVPGTYQVDAEFLGMRSSPISVVLRTTEPPRLQIVLQPASDAASRPSAGSMEFSDQPVFSVAGVTDWTAVGGHGSDVTLRTSEDLARETMTLGRHTDQTRTTSATTQPGESAKETSLRAALTASPENYTANRNLGEFYLRTGRYVQSIGPLEAASSLDHGKAADEWNLALACRGAGDLPQARQHITRALAQKPDDGNIHRVIGELDEALGDPLSAVQHEERAAKLAPSEENYFTWGSELLLHRAISQAAQVFAAGANLHPTSARMETGWGAALFAGAHYDEAAQRFCQASDLDPSQSEPYLLIGKVLVASPVPLTCVAPKLARYAAAQPNRADANYLYAMALLKQGAPSDLQSVRSLLEKAVDIDPHYAEASLQLGILAYTDHRYANAIELYNKALEADPQLAEAQYRLAVAYDRTGKPAEARQHFQEHDRLAREQADKVEGERRQVKQFVVVGPNP